MLKNKYCSKVNFSSTFELIGNHIANPDYDTESYTFIRTRVQTEMIRQGVANEAKPKVIHRNMENANLFSGGRVPTALELNNKIAHVRKQHHGSSQIFDTHKLREKINEFSEIPDNDLKGYIVCCEVHDEDENVDPRFNIIWTSKKLMNRISDYFIQDDATHRLVWQGKIHFHSEYELRYLRAAI